MAERYTIETLNFILVPPYDKKTVERSWLDTYGLQVAPTLYALPSDECERAQSALEKFKRDNPDFFWHGFRIAEEFSPRQERLKTVLINQLREKFQPALAYLENACTKEKPGSSGSNLDYEQLKAILADVAHFAGGFSMLDQGFPGLFKTAERCREILDGLVAGNLETELGKLVDQLKSVIVTAGLWVSSQKDNLPGWF